MASKKRTTSLKNRALMLLAPVSVALLLLLAVTSMVKAGPQPALVVLLTTGSKDTRQPEMALRYAAQAKQSGRYSEVVLVAEGHGGEALSGQASAKGVRVIVSDGAVKLAEIIGQQYKVIHF